MKISIRLLIWLSLAVLYCSCSQSGGNSASYDGTLLSEKESLLSETSVAEGKEAVDSYERKQTKNGTIRFETSDAEKTRTVIREAVAEAKGYISSDNRDEYDNHIENTVTIRVPAANFDALLDKISSNASKISYKNIEVVDVTQEYIDLDTRIKTKKELETRYQELLKRANTVEDILKIEEQIGKLRADIESAEGQLRYLSNQVALSTLTVTFYEKAISAGFAYKFGTAVRNGWDNFLWLLIGLANLWAIILFVAIVWIVILRLLRKRKKARQHDSNQR